MVHVTAANYHENEQYLNWLMLFFNQVSRFGTPLFALISGFLLYNQAIKGRYHLKKFVTSRFTKIIIPFLVWSIFYLLYKSYSFPELTDYAGIKQLLYTIALGKSNYHLYFIAVVIQFYLLFPFVQRFHSKKQLFYLTLLSLYVNYFHLKMPLDIGSGILNQFIHERAFIFNWIFYFFLGGLLVHYWRHLMDLVKKHQLSIAMLAFIVIAFTTYEYLNAGEIIGSTRVANLLHAPIMMIALTGVYFLMGNVAKIRNFILQIGNMSMGIYLVHPVIIYFLRDEFTILVEKTRWVPIAYMITLLLSMVIVKLINMLPFGQYIVIVAGDGKKGRKR